MHCPDHSNTHWLSSKFGLQNTCEVIAGVVHGFIMQPYPGGDLQSTRKGIGMGSVPCAQYRMIWLLGGGTDTSQSLKVSETGGRSDVEDVPCKKFSPMQLLLLEMFYPLMLIRRSMPGGVKFDQDRD